MLPLLVYGVGEMTRPLAGAVIVKALLGLDQWAGKPPSALPLYICQSTGACLMDAEEKEPLDRDVREWEFDRKMWGEGHELVGRYPPNRPSDRAEALLYLGRHHGQELKEARLSGRWNEYPGDMLAVVREDAFKAFGMASFLEQPRPDPAPAAVQSEPAAAPEQRAEPAWKNGDEWTADAVAEMARLYAQDGLSLSAIGRIMGDRVGGPAISRQRVREKIPDAVRSGKGKCKGARG
jgi:pyruvate/2-oxoglutarate dehydrogenase complex dihydrolipoamide acyltransferase (E2) component